MNPARGLTAADLLRKVTVAKLMTILEENADEPQAELLAGSLAGRSFAGTREQSG